MARKKRKRRSSGNTRSSDRLSGSSRSRSARLRILTERFSRFRMDNRPGTRIPDELRLATVEAMKHGVPRVAIMNACGVSSAQLGAWEKNLVGETSLEMEKPRVFSVSSKVEEMSHKAGTDMDHGLELVINGWSIFVRRSTR